MDEYLISKETLDNTAFAIRACISGNGHFYKIADGVKGEPAQSTDTAFWFYLQDNSYDVGIDSGYNFHILIPSSFRGKPVTRLIDLGADNYNSVQMITIPKSIQYIDALAFQYCESLYQIYFLGTEEEWNNIDNSDLISDLGINITFNATLNRLYYEKEDDNTITYAAVREMYWENDDPQDEMFFEYDADPIEGNSIFAFISYDYLENNEGVVVPVLYKTDENYLGLVEELEVDPPDFAEPYFYVGTAEIDGVTYDKWRKIELGDIGDLTWESDAKRFSYTNRIVEYDGIDPVDFPDKVYEVYDAGRDTTGATASVYDILWGKTAWVDGELLEGRIPIASKLITETSNVSLNLDDRTQALIKTNESADSTYLSIGSTIEVNVPLESFGNVEADGVQKGKTFTSSAGVQETGTANKVIIDYDVTNEILSITTV